MCLVIKRVGAQANEKKSKNEVIGSGKVEKKLKNARNVQILAGLDLLEARGSDGKGYSRPSASAQEVDEASSRGSRPRECARTHVL